MAVGLTITRVEYTASDLRCFAGRCSDGAQVRRILALAMVLDGRSRTEAAEQNGMDRQTLRDWVHRYNAEGVDGLSDRVRPGRNALLKAEQKAELKALVIAGPDLATHEVVRWRCKDIRAEVAKRFGIKVHESTIGKWLHDIGLARLQPRPVHPKKDPEAEATFKKTSQTC